MQIFVRISGFNPVRRTTKDGDLTAAYRKILLSIDAQSSDVYDVKNVDDVTKADDTVKRTIEKTQRGRTTVKVVTRNTNKRKDYISGECKTILGGSKEEIQKLRNISKSSGIYPAEFAWKDVTTDIDVLNIASNCSNLRKMYRFPMTSEDDQVTDEELQFPLAYSILTHNNIHQTTLLLTAIYRSHNIHCIHLDQKASPESLQALESVSKCFPNVFLSTKRIRVVYASVSRLLADIACMNDLLAIPKTLYDWKYLINLCSQDFPLRTNKEIVEQLKVFKGFNSIGGYPAPDPTLVRTKFVHRVENITKDGQMQEKVMQTTTAHSPPPFNMTVLKNLAYNFFTREFLQWALVESVEGRELLEWSMDTYSPDEHYWLMLHTYPGAPGGSSLMSGYQLARYIKWSFTSPEECYGVWRHYICNFGAENVYNLTTRRELFVNKLDIHEDATGVYCLRQWLDERRATPNHSRQNTNPDKNASIPSISFYI